MRARTAILGGCGVALMLTLQAPAGRAAPEAPQPAMEEPGRSGALCFRFTASYSELIDKEACMVRTRRFQGSAMVCWQPESVARPVREGAAAVPADVYGKRSERPEPEVQPPPDPCRAKI